MDITNVKPGINRVLVEVLKEENKNSSIIIPETLQKKSTKGRVIGIGFTRLKGEAVSFYDIYIGDLVVFEERRGAEFHKDGKLYNFLPYDAVLGVYYGTTDEWSHIAQSPFGWTDKGKLQCIK